MFTFVVITQLNVSIFAITIERIEDIRLLTKFLRFFSKFYFYFLTLTTQLAFSYICTTTIYDLSPTLGQR